MSRASWYCHKCETYGGGEPCNMSMKEHIDFEHEGGIVRMKEVNK